MVKVACVALVLAVLSAGCLATLAQAPPRSDGGWLKVERVVDGDTFKVRGDTVRVIGLDTPETVHPGRPVECYGPEASREAHRLLDGVWVRLEPDSSQGARDRYGRRLAYVWLEDGRMFEEVMIAGGFGEEYTYDDAYRHQVRLRAAETSAVTAGRGMWEACQGGMR